MGKDELLRLAVQDVLHLLTAEEMVHIARVLGAFWTYDYEAAKQGRGGEYHAELKSKLHSDGFLVSKILLEPENIRGIIAHQMVMRMKIARIPLPDYVTGIPDGAKTLGTKVSEILGIKNAIMEKIDGRIVLKTEIPPGAALLLIEDFCTRGTGFREAVLEIKNKQPRAELMPYEPVILNRGGLEKISVEGVGDFTILPIVEQRIQDWDPDVYCPRCAWGSKAIKPKETDENWRLLTTSQLE